MMVRWDDNAIEELIRLWPTHSASSIAKILGTTRNAVIGKVYRLDLPYKRPPPSFAEYERYRYGDGR